MGFFRRILKRMYENYMYGGPVKSKEVLTVDEVVEIAARQTYLNSDEYKRQQMVDQIARNQEELERRKISQAMTWLYPRFEDKLDELLNELKKK